MSGDAVVVRDDLAGALSTPRRRRVRAVAVTAAAALVGMGAGVAGYAVVRAGNAPPPSPTGGVVPVGTATVRRMDVVATQQLTGVLGYATPGTVVSQLVAGASTQTPAQAQAAVDAARAQLSAARTALNDLRSVDAVTLSQAQAAVARAESQNNAAAITSAQDALALVGPHNRQAEDAASSQVAAAQAALETAQAQQGAASSAVTPILTAVPSVGAVVDRGQPLFSVGGRPIPLLIGAVPAYRTLAAGVSDGPDVSELEDNLARLGVAPGLPVDGRWSAALTAAVSRWQTSLRVPATGSISLGDVEFLPGPIRVTGVHVAPGAVVQAGTPILDDTSTARVVIAQLSAGQSGALHGGDAVTVALPDGRSVVPGHVQSVASTQAQATSGQGPGQQVQQQNGAPSAQITVTITIDDPSTVAAFDAAPVTVTVTSSTAHGVLAVPVDALLALEGGGFAVEVVNAGGAHELLAVTPGLFDGSAMVEVHGPRLAEGMTVVVPAT